MHPLLAEFPVVIELPVQWGDQDALGHVNNVVFFRWWESSRIAYAERAGILRTRPDATIGTVLVSVKCDFRKQLHYPDTILVGARLQKIGNSSFSLEHRLISRTTNELAAEASSTMVTFNFQQQASQRIPDDVRSAIRALEGSRAIEGFKES